MAAKNLNIKGILEHAANTRKLKGKGVKIGFQSGGPRYDGVTALDVAIYNVYGTRTAEPRDFMSQTMQQQRARIDEACRRAAVAVQAGAGVGQTLGQLGAFYQTLMRWQIVNGSYAPNKASTVERKGSAKPLVDTGRVLVPNITYVVL